jgi:hypothetical protein
MSGARLKIRLVTLERAEIMNQGKQTRSSTPESKPITTREADRILEQAVERERQSGGLRITEGQRENGRPQEKKSR